MLNQVLEDIKKVPGRLTAESERLTHQAHDRLTGERVRLAKQARGALAGGRVGWWEANRAALTRVGSLLREAPELPGKERVEQAIEARLEAITAPPVAGWDAMNAKSAIAAVREVSDPVALHLLRHREEGDKNRRTVLVSIDERRAQL